MTDEPTPPRRRPMVPLMDRLGELCRDGKEAAEYLWQVPHDEETRRKIAGMLTEIGAEAAKQNRGEMGRLAAELEAAARASPSPPAARSPCCCTAGPTMRRRGTASPLASRPPAFAPPPR